MMNISRIDMNMISNMLNIFLRAPRVKQRILLICVKRDKVVNVKMDRLLSVGFIWDIKLT